MSYIEYEDLCLKAQQKQTKYVVYSLDIKNSHSCSLEDRKSTIKLMFNIKKEFEKLEKETNKKFLVKNKDVKLAKTEKDFDLKDRFLCSYNPNFCCGDFITFYFYNKNIDYNLFFTIFQKTAKELNVKLTYHFASLNYETNDYLKGNVKYWSGYAQQKLNNDKFLRTFDINKDKIINLKCDNLTF